MSQARYRQIAEIGAMGIFFGCGHRFIVATERTPPLVKGLVDHLRCPLCYDSVCPACLAPFSGEWDTCDSCFQFCEFEIMANKALSKGIYRIKLEYGILMVPSVGTEWTQVLDWPDSLCLGIGYVDYEHDVDSDGEIYACEPMRLELFGISKIDEQGDSGIVELGGLKTEMQIVNVDQT
ncbi:hypothetical protein F5B19DRAFT_63891 [Rostrohypoxylon terebratum]|nr:hypothetical protein F5B19DRAFT_63891 [Rostrohypoxylon terebratum]